MHALVIIGETSHLHATLDKVPACKHKALQRSSALKRCCTSWPCSSTCAERAWTLLPACVLQSVLALDVKKQGLGTDRESACSRPQRLQIELLPSSRNELFRPTQPCVFYCLSAQQCRPACYSGSVQARSGKMSAHRRAFQRS